MYIGSQVNESRLLKQNNLNKLRKRLLSIPDENASAAVAILIKEIEDDLELFLVKRAVVNGDPWSGDIAFPGGKRSSEDNNIYDTAKRELREETGIDLNGFEFVGVMPIEQSNIETPITVQPFIFYFKDMPSIKLSYELQSYLWAPLRELKATRTRSSVKGSDVPIFSFNDEVVWGLTFRILEKFLDLLEED
jgi:8-oxo-dGTP pyrophosphatase MutT (NUDIX family)